MAVTTVLTSAGRTNTDPATLRTDLVNGVAAQVPGYSADLPGALIEDIASTDVGALVVQDQMVTELINSVTPYGANAFILNQMGQITGVLQGASVNTSVYVVFTGPAGFVIAKGFTVSDGTYQYTVQDGGIIATGGVSDPLYCVATISGTWSVPANTVTQIITSVPSSISLAVNNPNPGTPSAGTQTEENYRALVLQAYGRSAAQGMATYLKTQLAMVSGVQSRLVAVQQGSGGYKIIVGGGDPYNVASAIFKSVFDITGLVGSSTTSRNITVTIYDYPDTYSIVFVNPPAQSVVINLLWDTISTNVVSSAAVASLGNAALVSYVNSVSVGQPLNLFEMQNAFQESIASIIPPALLTRMVFSVEIDGTPVSPTAGTGIIAGDSEGYFQTNSAQISIARG